MTKNVLRFLVIGLLSSELGCRTEEETDQNVFDKDIVVDVSGVPTGLIPEVWLQSGKILRSSRTRGLCNELGVRAERIQQEIQKGAADENNSGQDLKAYAERLKNERAHCQSENGVSTYFQDDRAFNQTLILDLKYLLKAKQENAYPDLLQNHYDLFYWLNRNLSERRIADLAGTSDICVDVEFIGGTKTVKVPGDCERWIPHLESDLSEQEGVKTESSISGRIKFNLRHIIETYNKARDTNEVAINMSKVSSVAFHASVNRSGDLFFDPTSKIYEIGDLPSVPKVQIEQIDGQDEDVSNHVIMDNLIFPIHIRIEN